jgi:predicted lipoprotein
MMRAMRHRAAASHLVSLCMTVACLLLGTAAQAETDHAAIARATLGEIIRPGFTALAESATELGANVETLCTKPSAENVEAVKLAFADTVSAWSKVEILRFGPITKEHRYERLFYWPDPKSIGTRQVSDALAKKDPAVTDPAKLAAKSVALQGLPALEYLLYGGDPETLVQAGGDGEFRCRFAASIAANIATIAKEVTEAWADGAPAAKSFLEPGPDDPAYRTPKEVTHELFKALTAGIELVRDQKLAKPLGAKPEQAKPRLAPLWRSGLTFANMAGNLDGVRALFANSGFAQIVAQESPGVERSVLFDLNHAISVLRGIGLPADEAFRGEGSRAKLEALRVSLKSARDTAGSLIARGVALSFGFNAMDGD